jgi:hypothetical protein
MQQTFPATFGGQSPSVQERIGNSSLVAFGAQYPGFAE